MVIYKITNKINQKVYVGQTKGRPEKRWIAHRNSVGKVLLPLYIDIEKYGVENFIFEIIDTALSLAELNKKEEHYIQAFKCTDRNKGYNIKLGGDNHDISEETKAKIARSNKGKKRSKEVIAKYKLAAQKRWSDPLYRERMISLIVKSTSTPEAKAKNREANQKMWKNPSFIRKVMEAKSTADYKKKESDLQLAIYAKPFDVYRIIKKHNKIVGIGEYVGTWDNKVTCAKTLGFKDARNIRSALSGTKKSAGGYAFIYRMLGKPLCVCPIAGSKT